MRRYLWIVDAVQGEDAAWCERAEALLRETEGDERQIDVRLPFGGEVCGTFFRNDDGTLASMRWASEYDRAEADTIEALVNEAWMRAWQAVPADPDAHAAAGELAEAARLDAEESEAADREVERDGTPEAR